jgi:hypothetical protein
MEIFGWIGIHWFDLLQTASILVGMFIAVHSIREDTKERRIENLFTLTNAHREIWWKLYERAELTRILRDRVNLTREPVTTDEELFVHCLILHLRAAFKARDLGMQFDDDAMTSDIREMFVLPIPASVWENSKRFQDADFVSFVDACIAGEKQSERAA